MVILLPRISTQLEIAGLSKCTNPPSFVVVVVVVDMGFC
jgi:hypothetical protein